MIGFALVCCSPGPRNRKRSVTAIRALKILRSDSASAAVSFVASAPAGDSGSALDFLVRNAPDLDSAETLFGAHSNPSAVSYTTLMQSYIRSGDVSGAEEVWRRMLAGGVQPDIVTYNVMMSAHAKKSDYAAVERKFEELQENGLRPDVVTYNTLMRSVRDVDVERVWEYFDTMVAQGVLPTDITFSTLIDAIGKDGDLSPLPEIPSMMRAYVVHPNIFIYTAVMSIYSRAGDTRNVRHWFNSMSEFGIKPNVVAYGILLDCLCKSGASEEAEGYFERMGRDGIQLNEKILTVMMRIRSDQGDVNGVKELFYLLENPRLFRYNVLIHALGMNGNISEATELLETMEAKGVTPDVVTFNTMMKMRAATGDLEGVKAFYEAISKNGLVADGFSRSILMDALGDAGELEQAMAVELLPSDDVPRTIKLRIASDHGDVASVKRILGEAPSSYTPDSMFLVRAYARKGDWQMASRVYNSEPVTRSRLASYLKLLGENGNVSHITRAMESARNSDIEVSEEMVAALIDAYGVAGKLDSARETLTSMEELFGIVPTIISYTALMGVQRTRKGRHDVLELLFSNGLDAVETIFRVMWSAAMEEGDLDDAAAVIELMREHRLLPHVSLYNKLIVAFGNKRDLVNVEVMVARMKKAGMRPSVVTYNALMDAFGKTLRSPVAGERLLNDMHSSGVAPDAVTFNTLAAIYARCADPDGVNDVVARMAQQNILPDKFTYSNIITANRRAGRADQAQEAAEQARAMGILH